MVAGVATQAAKKSAATSTTKPAAAAVAPLTGLPDPTGVAQTRPVLSVKVENTPEARPQSGIEDADIVWDEVVEGQITRLLAMFQSKSADVVGPIRSVRLTDPLIVWPVGGIFAFSGGAKYALNAIEDAPVTLVDENKAGTAMFRDRTRRGAPQPLRQARRRCGRSAARRHRPHPCSRTSRSARRRPAPPSRPSRSASRARTR